MSLTDEQLGSFRRAFVDRRASHIGIDGWSPTWQREDTAAALKLGLLTVSEHGDEQYTQLIFRPTEAFLEQLRQIAQ